MAFAFPRPILIEDYLAWTEVNPDERTELIDGVIVAMAPERGIHGEVKTRVTAALFNAVQAEQRPCRVYTDSVGVAISDRNCFIPDVVVQCGAPIPGNDRLADAPMILVEVLSPSTRYVDMTRKLLAYFRRETVAHYLVLDPDARTLAHHFRGSSGIEIATFESGALTLDPPGLTLDVPALFP